MAVLNTGADICPFCQERVDKDDIITWHLVRGWVKGIKKDCMTLREYSGLYAHNDCIKKAKAGQAPDQPTLMGDDPIEVGTPITISVKKALQDEDLAKELFDDGK